MFLLPVRKMQFVQLRRSTMQKVAKFEKVSFPQFYEAMKSDFGEAYEDGDTFFQVVNHQYEALRPPRRSTTGSAGYDFFSPISFRLAPGQSMKIPTGIRAIIDEGWWLMFAPRSGHGFKYFIRMANIPPVVDADYAFSDNEGHIFIKIRNEGDQLMEINAGDAFAQGIFLPFGITYDDDADGVRNGGLGSTGR